MDSKKDDESSSWSCWLRTIFAVNGCILLVVFVGIESAQSSVMLPQLKTEDSLIRATPDEETWIASLGIVMAPVSAMFIGPFTDAFGRRKGLQMFFFISGSGYAVIASARNVYQIYIGRIICGLGIGLTSCAGVYSVEVYTPKQREILFAITSALVASGVTLMSIIGGYLPWQIASLILSVTCFVIFFVQWFIPESPAWLFKIGREDAAIRSYQRLGRAESNIRRELDILRLQCVDKQEKLRLQTFLAPTVWKPFVIMVTLLFLATASGIDDLQFYAVDFIERLGTGYDPVNVNLMVATTRLLVCSTFVIFFRAKVGRRFALAFSSFWMTVAFGGLGAYEYVYRHRSVSERPFQWLTVAFLLLYMSASVLGMLGLPLVMSGEVYPLKVRGTMSGITHVVRCGVTFVFVKIYHVCIDMLQIYGLLFTFAAFSLVAIFFSVYILPETQNKSLYEIEQGFSPKKNKHTSSEPQIK